MPIPATDNNNRPTRRAGAGFSLIELMIVVAIVGILASIAVPAFQRNTIRAQVAEGITLAGRSKASIVDAFMQSGTPPVDRAAAGLTEDSSDTRSTYVTALDIDNGTVVVTFGNEAHNAISGEVLTIIPYETSDKSVIWRCGFADIPEGIEVLGTAGGGATAPLTPTTIAAAYLPATCRN